MSVVITRNANIQREYIISHTLPNNDTAYKLHRSPITKNSPYVCKNNFFPGMEDYKPAGVFNC